jgi:hypothetical protein
MSDIALRPRSPTELVDAAFQLYRRDPLPFITALASVYVPWLLIIAMSGLSSMMTGQTDPAQFDLGPWMFVIVGGGVAYVLAASVTTVLASDAYFGRAPDLAKAYRVLIQRLGHLLVATLLFGICLMMGFFLFFIPGLYVFGRLFANKQVVLLENVNGISAIGRSWRLSKGSVRHVINTMGLVILLNFAVGFGANLFARLIPSQIVQLLIATAVSVVVYPLVGILETLLYYDVRIRREGFDIEYLAAASPAPAAESSTSI